ncbi:MAG: ABC transporter permease [Promethearchaeota archaeon]
MEKRELFMSELRAIYAITVKDLVAYYLKPPNLSWGIFFPVTITLIFLLVRPLDMVALAPGLIGVAVLFGTTSMAAIDVTFERRTGTLDRLIAAPISIPGLALAKILAATIFGFMMAAVMLIIVTVYLGALIINWSALLVAVSLSAFTCSAFGVLIAVGVREVFEAQTLLNFFRFPMIFLCGVFFPFTQLPVILIPFGLLLPLTYAVDLLRFSLMGTLLLYPPLISASILFGYFLILYTATILLLRNRFR